MATTVICTSLLRSAISIAIRYKAVHDNIQDVTLWIFYSRYSAVRKQFGPSPDIELPVIDYQLQVCSLPVS